MNIRVASSEDRDAIKAVHLRAFPESENETVAKLALDLLLEETIPETFSLVVEVEGAIVGHIAFSPVTVGGGDWTGYILAPLAVVPEHQKQHIGSAVVKSGMDQLTEMGANLLLVYGDPKYYERFGFSTGIAANFLPPYELKFPFGWQARVLNSFEMPVERVWVGCVKSLSRPELW